MSGFLGVGFGFIVLSLGAVAAIVYALDVALRRYRFPQRARTAYGYLVGISLLVYLTSLTVLVQTDYFARPDALPARVFGMFAAGVGVCIFLLLRPRFRQLLRALPERWLVGAQSYRMGTEGLLFLGYQFGFVPFQLTFYGFNQDIIVGITAALGYFAFFGRGRMQFQIILWNVFGMLLQFVLLANIIMSLPSRWQVFRNLPDAEFLVQVPFVWLPGFLMPLAVGLHLFSLLRAWRG